MTTKPVILVAEDDNEDRRIMEDAFREIGHEGMIKILEDGIELINYLKKETSSGIKLIVLDLNMPLLNGTEVLRLLKQNNSCKAIPVIIFSTSLNNIEKRLCLELGAREYITKPSNYSDYIQTCREMVAITNETAIP